jgi:DNA-binding transcriptional ArsR family regulator
MGLLGRLFGSVDERLVDEIISLLNRIDQICGEDYSAATKEGTTLNNEWKTIDNRLYSIGQELYDKGGMNLMRKVYDRVYKKGRLTGRYLERAWDGAGEWRG